jgi:hypothetical protein
MAQYSITKCDKCGKKTDEFNPKGWLLTSNPYMFEQYHFCKECKEGYLNDREKLEKKIKNLEDCFKDKWVNRNG